MLQLITITLIVISIIVTFFAPIWGWGILGVPALFLLWQVLFARFSRPRRFPELSEKANELLSRYAHFYLWSLGCRDMSASAMTLAIGGIVVAIINAFQGFYWGLYIGIANFGIQNYFSYTFVPDALIKAKGLQEEHREIVDYLDQVRNANQESMGETDSAEDQANEPVSEDQDHDAASVCPQCGATYVVAEGICSDCGVPLRQLSGSKYNLNSQQPEEAKPPTTGLPSVEPQKQAELQLRAKHFVALAGSFAGAFQRMLYETGTMKDFSNQKDYDNDDSKDLLVLLAFAAYYMQIQRCLWEGIVTNENDRPVIESMLRQVFSQRMQTEVQGDPFRYCYDYVKHVKRVGEEGTISYLSHAFLIDENKDFNSLLGSMIDAAFGELLVELIPLVKETWEKPIDELEPL